MQTNPRPHLLPYGVSEIGEERRRLSEGGTMELRQMPRSEDYHERGSDPNREGHACQAPHVIKREV